MQKSIQRRDGAQVAWQVSGQGSPVVLLSGVTCGPSLFAGLVPHLTERHTVIQIDARGHGSSTAPAPFTLEDLTADCLTVLDELQIQRAAWVGLSMGGMVAMRAALVAPERVAGVVLLSTSANAEKKRKLLQYMLLNLTLRTVGSGPVSGQFGCIMFGKTARREQPELVPRYLAELRALRRGELVLCIKAVIRRGDLRARLGEIQAPTLVVVGDEDPTTPLASAREIAHGILGARLEVLPQAGHLLTMEQPQVTGLLVAGFLSELAW